MRQLDFRLLGPLEVVGEDGSLPLGRRQQRAVLAILLVEVNRAVSTDRLIESLWPQKPPVKPQTAIQGYVSGLRKLLGREAIETSGGGYVLRTESEAIDAVRFEHLRRRGEEASRRGDTAGAAQELRGALKLWRGPALSDFCYDAWAQQEIARLEELRLVTQEQLFEARLALGQHAEVVGELNGVVAEQPLRERPRGQLMLALYRCGRQAEALETYQQAREQLREELGLDPSPELQQLYRLILSQDDSLALLAPAAPPENNLPASPNRLIGRERELEQVDELLRRDDVRLVTVTGPGGTGKTRFALQAAAEAVERFEGVFFVNLAALTDANLVVPTIAQSLELKEQPGEDVSETVGRLVANRNLLLLLDNFEQVVEAAPAISKLLSRGSAVKLLITSRAPLRLSGEREYPLPPLTDDEAVALFCERAQAAKPSFSLNGNRPVVAEICQRLDRLPLAIELAATRIKLLTEQALLERLSERLKLLTGGARDVDERQQTLRAAIDWSHDLLSTAEQTLFRRLAVFAGGRTLEAIDAVCNPNDELDVFEGIASLVDKSLLRQDEASDGDARFVMLETIHEYAREQLMASGEEEELRQRHARYFLGFVEQADVELRTPRHAAALGRLTQDYDNLRAAIEWARASNDRQLEMALVAALGDYWYRRSLVSEGRRHLRAALETGWPHERARALSAASRLAASEGTADEAKALAEEALRVAREASDWTSTTRALSDLAVAEALGGDVERCRVLLEESVSLAASHGVESYTQALALMNLGVVLALYLGEYEAGQRFLQQALGIYIDLGQQYLIALSLHNLGFGALVAKRTDEARRHFTDSLTASLESEWPEGIVYDFEGLAATEDDPIRASQMLGFASTVIESAGVVIQPAEAALHEETVTRLRDTLGDVAFDEAWVEGRCLTLDEACAQFTQ